MEPNDRRLIEDFLPIRAISAEASREKSVRKGHISTLHLWWARRPLVACRAAVYGALVPLSRFRPSNGPEEKRDSLARANAAKFVERLCKYPGSPQVIAEAQKHVLEAHAERLSKELGKPVTVEDIEEGRAPRPKVLDMFAGGGAIPLEALRLGCEAYALELNPVAHIIELCTLVYPQKYGKPDKNAKGSAPDGTWAGLAEEVRYWGKRVLEKVKAEIGDLYPSIPDPNAPKTKEVIGQPQTELAGKGFDQAGQQKLSYETPKGYLTPVAYLWTRTVRCKRDDCGAIVPLVKQTWLCKKKDRYVALKVIAPKGDLPAAPSAAQAGKRVRFEVVEDDGIPVVADNEWIRELKSKEKKLKESELRDMVVLRHFGFDPEAFSKAGNATCPFCSTVADSDYVKAEGCAGRMGQQMMAAVCVQPGRQGKTYISADDLPNFIPDDEAIQRRIEELCKRTGLTVPREPIVTDAKNSCWTHLYGLTTFGDLFTPRQMLCLLTFAATVRVAEQEMRNAGYSGEQAKAISTFCGLLASRLADWNSSISHWIAPGEKVSDTFARQAIPMAWDFSEIQPLAKVSGSSADALERIKEALETHPIAVCGEVKRGTSTNLPWSNVLVDAVVTDPPYYDNVPYANLSDFFYIWLKRSIGTLYPEHFSAERTPKKNEIVADAVRHGGDREKAKRAYEAMMAEAFKEAHRVLKPSGPMAVVYAHKTTLGWATLIDALRTGGFTVYEAWPLETEKPGRLREQESAALASSIFLVARKREDAETGPYEDVRAEMERIVRERVEALWEMGITGADLNIAAVGAGLRAFTRFVRVEYANGDEVLTAKFLTEVEGVVLELLLEKIFKVPRSGLAAVDAASKFYVLWRFQYKHAEIDAGEAIVFVYPQGVELDGARGLTSGPRALVEKKKSKMKLKDYGERGEYEKLGLPNDDGTSAPLVDVLHRTLWLMENRPAKLSEFLDAARPDQERLRLVAQALAGPALQKKDGELGATPTAEQSALSKLTANWRSLIEENLFRSR